MSGPRIRVLSVAAVAAAAGLLPVTAVPASARAPAAAPRMAGPNAIRRTLDGAPMAAPGVARRARPGQATSSTPGYAGYQVSPGSSPAKISFTVPTLSCPAKSEYLTIPGVIVGGSSYLGAGVALDCSGGRASYRAVAFFNGPFDYLNMTVSPGDAVSVKVSDASTSKAAVTDTTTGVAKSASFAGFPVSYVDLGDDFGYDYYTPLGIPLFGSITFTGASVGGTALGSASPAGYNMGNGTINLIDTSAVDSAGTGFSTTFIDSLYPTSVQGRVVEGTSGNRTLAATVWPATFTSTVSSSPADFTATIYWGDGSPAATGSISAVAAGNCTYSPLPPAGTCFAVTGRHLFTASGDYQVTVVVTGPGGTASAGGIAEIVPPGPVIPPVADSIGVLTWTTANGSVEECTATALAGLDIAITARHCFDNLSQDSDFQFAPQHTGNCGSGSSIMSLSACEAAGQGNDPYGYWVGTGALAASETGVTNAGHDTVLIGLDDTSSLGYSLLQNIPGLPIHFDPPHGQLHFSAYGYPGRVGVWSLQSCPNELDLSVSSDSVVGISPCDFGQPSGLAGGTSGGPFVSSRYLLNAISATMWFVCQAGTACQEGEQLVWPHQEPQNTAVGNLMSNNAMQLYVVAVLGVPQP
jgi:hypothetical protein